MSDLFKEWLHLELWAWQARCIVAFVAVVIGVWGMKTDNE